VDIIGGVLAEWLAAALVRAGHSSITPFMGDEVDRCLTKVATRAIERTVAETAPGASHELRYHLCDLVGKLLLDADDIKTFLGPAILGETGADRAWQERAADRLGDIDWTTIEFAACADITAAFPKVLREELRAEGARPGSPIFNLMVLGGMHVVQAELKEARHDIDRWLLSEGKFMLDAGEMLFSEPSTGIEMIRIPGGVFEMGVNDALACEGPAHWVCVSSFWISRTPVTNAQYNRFVIQENAEPPLSFTRPGFAAPEQPVVGISWDDAEEFCRWLTHHCDYRFDLPTEAQWEYAARGPQSLPFPWGEGEPGREITHYGLDPAAGYTVGVDDSPQSQGPFGTTQQLGNVWEWCLDEWHPEAYVSRARNAPIDPVLRGPARQRAVRGAGWQCTQERVRSAHRCRNNRDFRGWATGLRVAAGRG
jgi:sulfatase modifying factor 1